MIVSNGTNNQLLVDTGVLLAHGASARLSTNTSGVNIYGDLDISSNITGSGHISASGDIEGNSVISNNGVFFMGGTSIHGIVYKDINNDDRYAMFINNDIVALTNRAASGSTMIMANGAAAPGTTYERRMIGVMPYNGFMGFYKSGSYQYNDTQNTTKGH